MKKVSIYLSVLTILFSTSLSAFDFNEANNHFSQRENNPSAIAKARSLYEQGLNSSSKSEQLYAVEQLGRLAYYEGDLLTPQSESSKRVKIFDQCLEYVETINPSKFGKTEAYYYWKTTCLALWGRAAGMFSAAGRLGELKDNMKQGLELDSNYAGGGLHRVIANIKLHASWLSGLQDRPGALVQIELAIQKGPQFYNAYLSKAEILRALNNDGEALQVLETAKKELERLARNNQLPAGYEPESKVFLKQIKEALKK